MNARDTALRAASRIAAALFLALPPAAAAQDGAEAPPPLAVDEVRVFAEALEWVRRAYVEETDDATLLEHAIRGMLDGLDPHSSYIAGDDYGALRETATGEFGGLGIEVSRGDGYIRVVSPLDGTPADRAGIRAGDLIVRIDGRPLGRMTPDEVSRMMRGEPGTEVAVTIARDGAEPFELSITREVISIASVRDRMLEPGYAYVRIAHFRLNTGEELAAALERLRADSPELRGIVLDLRNNPGGVLQAAVGVVDGFIDRGLIVYTEGRFDNAGMRFSATPETAAPDVPLAVLINGGSASASEIVAGALQAHGRAVVMGTRSFGKGSVQTLLPLADSRAIRLTTALYYTPDGRSIQARGIVPDIVVDDAFVTRRARRPARYGEENLAGHLENESGEETAGSDAEMAAALLSAEEVLVADYPLNEALNVLKGIHAFRGGF